jgi:hypothetical protein
MFNVERDAIAARRFEKCRNIYDKGQELAWNGNEVLGALLKEHEGVKIDDARREALKRLFSIILWGELAAWKVSAQLADQLEPLEAKMAATSQAHDEARHFYVMYDYLKELGYTPGPLDRAPQALLDLVLETKNLAYKLLGMQLLVETMALTIFQTVRQAKVEPVITELMRYFEKDEARHVGLGMQYLPELIKGMSKGEVRKMLLFQARLIFWAIWETKILAEDFRVLGVDPHNVVELARRKQIAAVKEAFAVLGDDYNAEESTVLSLMVSAANFLFPKEGKKAGLINRFQSAWNTFWHMEKAGHSDLDVHDHDLKFAAGGRPAFVR